MNYRFGTVVSVAAAIVLAAPAAATSVDRAPAPVAAQDPANQAVVEALYAAFAQGDGPGIAAVLSPDLMWIEAEGGPYADLNPYEGPQAVFEGVFGRIGAAFSGFAATPVSYWPSGDRVFVEGRYTGTHIATGEVLDAQFVHVFTVRDGVIVAFQQYTDTAQWVDVVTAD